MIIEENIPISLKQIHRLSNYFIEGCIGLGIICVFLGLWELGSYFTESLILPHPIEVLIRSQALLFDEQEEILTTINRSFIAILSAFSVGALCGILAGSFKTFAKILKPLMDIFLGIPPIVWIVLALFWFGMGHMSVIFSVFIAIFPLSFAHAMLGVLTLNWQLYEVCIVYRLSYFKRLKYFYAPHILPHLLASLSIVSATGIKIMIMAELLGSANGVGAKIADARSFLDTTEVLAYVVIMVGFILLFEFFIIKPMRLIFLPWIKENN